jgi:lipoprotein-anchoring transpeptidase ErfK/SrfK
MKRAISTLTIAFLLAVTGAATASAEPPSPGANSPTGATLTLSTVNTGREDAVLVRNTFGVHGLVKPYEPGQPVTVTFTQRGKIAQQTTLTIAPSPSGDGSGVFDVNFTPHKAGKVTIKATTAATATQPSLTEDGLVVTVLGRHVRNGARGAGVRELQRLLARKGYVVGKRGVYDARTARAVMAFRKVTGMKRNFSANRAVMRALAKGRGTFHVKFPKHGRHVEGDIKHQVLVFAQGSKVIRIYPMSSGKPSTPTVRGSFRVYRKDPGTNAEGMVDSSYFIRGYAIHGYAEVPPYNASHGCLRVPIPDARSIFSWVHSGERVDTYA